jgi:hypothetical protein
MINRSKALVNREELKDPIFIIGCMRSGTGALARTIGLAESVCYIGETKVIAKYYAREVPITSALRQWGNGEALIPVLKSKVRKIRDQITGRDLLRQIIADMIRYTKLTHFDTKPSVPLVDRYGMKITAEDMSLLDQLCYKYERMNNIDTMIRVLFKDIQLLSGKAIVLEKTPMHALYIPVIQRLFPEARICHILRDGKQVAASYMLNYGQKKLSKRSVRYICTVHKCTRAIDERVRKSGNPKYYSLRYEDFIASPRNSVENVFHFLNLSVSESVLTSLRDIKPGPSNWERLPRETQTYVEDLLWAES